MNPDQDNKDWTHDENSIIDKLEEEARSSVISRDETGKSKRKKRDDVDKLVEGRQPSKC